jgi:hypothetical protein
MSIKMSVTRNPKLLCVAACLSWLAGMSAPSRAEIVLGGRNASGALDGSGTNKSPAPYGLYNYEGSFGSYLATPISPHYFVTAAHIGNGGGVFAFNNGTSSTTTYSVALAGTDNDLAIWHVTGGGAFSLYAPLFFGNNEVGEPLVSIGNGTTRGNPLTMNGTLAGWDVGRSFTNRSWQTNIVDAVYAPPSSSNDYLTFDFNRVADPLTGTVINPDEGIFSGGDSGGATFVLDPATGHYELAGINSDVDAVSLTSGGPGQTIALFDARGFYTYDPTTNGNTQLITDPNPVPLSSYATRISSRLGFVQQILGSEFPPLLIPLSGNRGNSIQDAVPEPGTVALLISLGLTGANFFALRKRFRQ